MPPVRSLNLDDGIRIVTTGGRTVQLNGSQINALSGNLAKKEERLNEWLQQQYESRYLLSEYDPDHRVRQVTPNLNIWERIEGDEIVFTSMWVAVHIYSLSPLKITVRTSNSPIGGDWWL